MAVRAEAHESEPLTQRVKLMPDCENAIKSTTTAPAATPTTSPTVRTAENLYFETAAMLSVGMSTWPARPTAYIVSFVTDAPGIENETSLPERIRTPVT